MRMNTRRESPKTRPEPATGLAQASAITQPERAVSDADVAALGMVGTGVASPAGVLALQRTLGNQFVTQRLATARRIPPTISASPTQDLRPRASCQAGAPAVLQRKKTTALPDTIDSSSIKAAQAWSTKEHLGIEAIQALQGTLGVPVSSSYDEATVKAVYARQRLAKPKGKIRNAGKATPEFFARLGLISTRTIVAATIDDATLQQIKERFSGGVTVAIYSLYDYGDKKKRHNNAEFVTQANRFATNQFAVGIDGGTIAIGRPVPIKALGEVIEVVQSIHRGLAERAAASKEPGAKEPIQPPAFTRVKNLALFAHGEPYGLGLNQKNEFITGGGGLHARPTAVYPANVKAFVQGLAGAVAPDVQVQLFACSAARDDNKKKESSADWQGHKQGERKGAKSFAAELAQQLGPSATVYGHTTAGHTTENFAARVFGQGAGPGGLQMFDVLYDDAFIQAELRRLFALKTDEERAALYPSLREQMWAHYTDSISAEHNRGGFKTVTDPVTKKKKRVKNAPKRYPAGTPPLGQEMFINRENAKRLLRADWTTWIEPRLKLVQPTPKPKGAKHAAKK